MRVWGHAREIKVRQFRETRMFVAGDREHLAAMQAELAGEAQDFLGFSGDGKYNGQCIFSHIVSDREIRIVDMVAEFPDI